MKDWKKEVSKIEEGGVREKFLEDGLASEIIKDYYSKQESKWEKEFAQELLKEQEKECKKIK